MCWRDASFAGDEGLWNPSLAAKDAAGMGNRRWQQQKDGNDSARCDENPSVPMA
jgi:hypothetical protein